MSTFDRYEMPTDPDWEIPGAFDSHFRWEYDDGRAELLNLYREGMQLQWNAEDRIDWSQDLDPENPEGLPDECIPIFGWDGAVGDEIPGWIELGHRVVGQAGKKDRLFVTFEIYLRAVEKVLFGDGRFRRQVISEPQ